MRSRLRFACLLGATFLGVLAAQADNPPRSISPLSRWRKCLETCRAAIELHEAGKSEEAKQLLDRYAEGAQYTYSHQAWKLRRKIADGVSISRAAYGRDGRWLKPAGSGNEKARLADIRSELLDGCKSSSAILEREPHRLLTALEALVSLNAEINEPAILRDAYQAIHYALVELGDVEGVDAWEDRALKESWITSEEVASILSDKAQRAFNFKNYGKAEALWRRVCQEHPTSKVFGVAQFNLAFALQKQKRYDEAIVEYARLFPSHVDDKEPGGNIMEAYRNYRHRAALQISACYEAQRNFKQAIDWAIQARDKYPYDSWCGTCLESSRLSGAANLVRLLALNQQRDDAVAKAEELVFTHTHGIALHVPQFLAEAYFEDGRTEKLRQRVEEFRQARFEKERLLQWKKFDEQEFDGHSDATRLVLDCLRSLELASREDLDGLWDQIQAFKVTALEAHFSESAASAAAGFAAERLISDRKSAVPFLKEQLRDSEHERAWAIVLLARLGTVTNVEAVHRMAGRVPEGRNDEERTIYAGCRNDYLYAVLVADPASRQTLYQRYRNTPLVYAAQNAMSKSGELVAGGK